MMMLLSLLAQFTAAEPPRVVSPAPTEQAIALYGRVALIREVREVTVPAGSSEIVFEGVNDYMIPQTASLMAFNGVSVERNFDSKSLTPASLYKASVGENVTVLRTDPVTGEQTNALATVLSSAAPDNQSVSRRLVLQTADGVEVLGCTGFLEGASFDRPPPDVPKRPELSIQVHSEEEATRRIEIAYLSGGFGWGADYVLTLGDGQDSPARLFGWLTMQNDSNGMIEEAPATVIAGSVRILPNTKPSPPANPPVVSYCWPNQSVKGPFRWAPPNGYDAGESAESYNYFRQGLAAPSAVSASTAEFYSDKMVVKAARVATEEEFGDYKLYRLPQPITLAPYQTKQVAFLDEQDIDVRSIYKFNVRGGVPNQRTVKGWRDKYIDAIPEGTSTTRPKAILFTQSSVLPTLIYDIDNSKDGTLARSLPKGDVRVMAAGPDGRPFFLGEGEIGNLAVDLPAEIQTRASGALAMESQMTAVAMKLRLRREIEWTVDVTATVVNSLDTSARVQLVLFRWLEQYNDFLVVSSTATAVEGRVPLTYETEVPPNSVKDVTWRVQFVTPQPL